MASANKEELHNGVTSKSLMHIPFRHVPYDVRRKMAVRLQPSVGHCWRSVFSCLGFDEVELQAVAQQNLIAYDCLCALKLFPSYDSMPENSVGQMLEVLDELGRHDVEQILQDGLPEIMAKYNSSPKSEKPAQMPSTSPVVVKQEEPLLGATVSNNKLSLNLSREYPQLEPSDSEPSEALTMHDRPAKHNISPTSPHRPKVRRHGSESQRCSSSTEDHPAGDLPTALITSLPTPTPSPPAPTPSQKKGHHTRVYITYTKSDQKMANELRVWLVQNRFLVAMDNHDLQERDNVRRRFEKVRYVLICVTPDYSKNVWRSSTSDMFSNPSDPSHLVYGLMVQEFKTLGKLTRFVPLCCGDADKQDVPPFLRKSNLVHQMQSKKDFSKLLYFLKDPLMVISQHIKQSQKEAEG